jgi:hypothetical protein
MKIVFSSKMRYHIKKLGIFLITAALIVGMVGCSAHTLPIEIRDWYDLDAIRNNLGSNYTLMNDLDSTTAGYEELASPTANEGKGWQPIGNFTGTFDGQGYEISDLFISRPDINNVGLFGYVDEGGRIEDIGIMNIAVTGNESVGSLAGANFGTVNNSYSTGSVSGGTYVGGLVGGSNGTVSNSYSTGSVTGNNLTGGLVGGNGGAVSNSYSTGNVTGEQVVGGLVGGNQGTVSNAYACGNVTGAFFVGGLLGGNGYSGAVSNSYSTGSVTGDYYVGGLVGENRFGGTVSNSYSTGNVTGNQYVGGLAGINYEGNVSNSYSTGSVTGDVNVGGLVGYNYEGTMSNSFWDTETSGQYTSAGGTGKTTEEMQDIATFNGVGWDIVLIGNYVDETWYINNGNDYPRLGWQL